MTTDENGRVQKKASIAAINAQILARLKFSLRRRSTKVYVKGLGIVLNEPSVVNSSLRKNLC